MCIRDRGIILVGLHTETQTIVAVHINIGIDAHILMRKKILSQVLDIDDQETTDSDRWKVEYTQEELSALILKRSGIDYGQIIDLIPIARGTRDVYKRQP